MARRYTYQVTNTSLESAKKRLKNRAKNTKKAFNRVNNLTNEIKETRKKAQIAFKKGDVITTANLGKKMEKLVEEINDTISVNRKVIRNEKEQSFIAHEIRSPLTMLGIYTGLINQYPSSRNVERWFKQIKESQHILADKSVRLLKPNEFKSTKISTFLKKIKLPPKFRNKVKLSIKDKLSREIKIDSGKMQSVLETIVDNACEMGAKNISIKTKETKDAIQLIIENDKTFIEPGQRDEIFRKGKSTRGSTGLGLYHAKRIVRENLGDITVEGNKKLRQTKFIINLKKQN